VGPPAATPPGHTTIDTLVDEPRLPGTALQRRGVSRAGDLAGGVHMWPAGLRIKPLSEGGRAMGATGCRCGNHLEVRDDEELFGLRREHVDRDHPHTRGADAQTRARVAADASGVEAIA
jgi:hypothetical protein